MTARQYALAQALARCTFTPGSTPKRFVRWAASQPRERELSDKAAAFLDRLGHQYRRQLGSCMSEHCERCHRDAHKRDRDFVELGLVDIGGEA